MVLRAKLLTANLFAMVGWTGYGPISGVYRPVLSAVSTLLAVQVELFNILIGLATAGLVIISWVLMAVLSPLGLVVPASLITAVSLALGLTIMRVPNLLR